MSRILRITIDGLDRTGKTTFKKELEKATNYKFHIIDRSTISNRMYDIRYHRNYEERQHAYNEIEIYERDYTANFILTANKNEIRNRLIMTHHEDIDIDKDVDALSRALTDTRYINIREIDTTNKTIQEEVKEALLFLDSLEDN